MIWRDDDISWRTNLNDFKAVHDLFKRYNVLHTIALITGDIEKAPELVAYIKDNDIDVQFHCIDHIDFTQNIDKAKSQIEQGIATIEAVFGKRPTVFYPTWNRTNQQVNDIAASVGLNVSSDKISLSQYIKVNGDVSEKVINFHYWAYEDVILIEPALKIFSENEAT